MLSSSSFTGACFLRDLPPHRSNTLFALSLITDSKLGSNSNFCIESIVSSRRATLCHFSHVHGCSRRLYIFELGFDLDWTDAGILDPVRISKPPFMGLCSLSLELVLIEGCAAVVVLRTDEKATGVYSP